MTETKTETKTGFPERSPEEWVERLSLPDARQRLDAYEALVALGPEALPAVRVGLGHGSWQARRWCAMWFDRHAIADELRHLLPLLHDPKAPVRLFAVHALACDRCKQGENPIEVVPLLIDRIRNDESIKVRRHATVMLAFQHASPELEPFFQELLDTETDPKLHKHAGFGVLLCRRAAEER